MALRRQAFIWLVLAAIVAIGTGIFVTRGKLIEGSAAQSVIPAANSQPVTGPIDAETFRRIAEAQTGMVVNVRTESRRQTRDVTDFFSQDDPFRRFFGPDVAPREQILEGAGSGFIVDRAGLVLTNHHVVDGATRIEVGLFAKAGSTGEDLAYAAKVIGSDPLTDSALLQITEMPDTPLPVATFGDSDRIAAGDWVMAIGNPFNLAHTVTVGVISARDRPFRPVAGRETEFMQTDAAINPGNSGGPLLNLRGEVIGINTAIVSSSAGGGNMGIGFAVPMNAVRELLPELREGKVTRGQIGVQVGPVPREAFQRLGLPDAMGALVSTVDPGGAAAAAGIQPGDVIVGYNGQKIDTTQQLVDLVVRTAPGTRVPIDVVRNGKRTALTATIQELQLSGPTAAPQASQGAMQTFGLTLAPVTPEAVQQLGLPAGVDGVVVTRVEPRGAAASGGVQPGDVILEVNRQPVRSVNEVAAALGADRTAFLLVQRRGQRVFLTMTK